MPWSHLQSHWPLPSGYELTARHEHESGAISFVTRVETTGDDLDALVPAATQRLVCMYVLSRLSTAQYLSDACDALVDIYRDQRRSQGFTPRVSLPTLVHRIAGVQSAVRAPIVIRED